MKIKKYTRVTAFFLAVCTVLLMLPLSVRADEYWPDGVKTQSKSAIVMEVNTGTVLYEKKSRETLSGEYHKDHDGSSGNRKL